MSDDGRSKKKEILLFRGYPYSIIYWLFKYCTVYCTGEISDMLERKQQEDG